MGYIHIALIFLAHVFLVHSQAPKVYTYCSLDKPPTDDDPDVVYESQAAGEARFTYPRAAVQRALSRDSSARAFVDAQAALSQQRAAQQSVSRNPARNAERSSSGKQYDAPVMYEPLCQTREDRVIGKFMNDPNVTDAFCFVVEPQNVVGKLCAGAEGDMDNQFGMYQRYYCAPDSYYFEPALVYCPHLDFAVYESIRVSSQCTCKRYHCNLDGMMMQRRPGFPQVGK